MPALPQETLQTYLTKTRRLLNDPGAKFWPDANLIDYINDARRWTNMTTGALRTWQQFNLTVGQEQYNFSIFPAQPVINVLLIIVVYGNVRYGLSYRSWNEMQGFRPYVGWTQIPIVFSVFGANSFWVGPPADFAYPAEADTLIDPTALVNASDICQLPYPYTEPVPYWAARMAKLEKQRGDNQDSQYFERLFYERVKDTLAGSIGPHIHNAYLS